MLGCAQAVDAWGTLKGILVRVIGCSIPSLAVCCISAEGERAAITRQDPLLSRLMAVLGFVTRGDYMYDAKALCDVLRLLLLY